MASSANLAFAFEALIAVSSTTDTRAEDSPDFYKGKTISLYVGSTSGGVYDVYARLLARHMGRHIPGNPNILPLNMEGAGGLRLANFLYNVAPKDGTVIGTINRGAPFEPLLGEAAAAKFDAGKFTWLGSASDEVSTCVVWKRAGIERFDELFAKEITVGGTGGTADTNQFPKAIRGVLGAKIKLVSGYPGGADIDLAMERGEVDGRCGWSWSSIVSTRKQSLDNGSIRVVVQLALHRHADLPDVLLIMDYAKTPEQREMLRLIFVRGALGCPFLAPPGIPANRAEILRRAFDATMQDASFLAEAKTPISRLPRLEAVNCRCSSRTSIARRPMWWRRQKPCSSEISEEEMKVFDMDSHLREEYVMDEVYRLEGKFADQSPVRLNDEKNVRAKFKHNLQPWPTQVGKHFNHSIVYDPYENWNGGEIARRQVGGWDMKARLAENEKEGIDHQMLFPTQLSIPTYIEGELGAALARAYNNWVKKLVAGNEDRLWPVGIMPWGHPDALVDELRHCVKTLGFKAIHLTPYSHKHTIDDPIFEPFYSEAEKLDVPLMLHPATMGELINRYDNFFAMHVLGRPFNCTAGLVALTTGGVFERHPNLRVAFFECSAEWILYWMHRMDDDYKRMKNDFTPKITKKPSEYLKKNCYVTCEADERMLRRALEEFNEDRVMLASDYPHFDSEYPGTVHELQERGDISDTQKQKILCENAKEFLRI